MPMNVVSPPISAFGGRAYIMRPPEPMREHDLHCAVGHGDVDAVSLLLQRGHNVNVTNSKGETPLHQAIEQQNVDVMRLLLKHGADPSKTPNYGVSTLYQAVETGKKEIVELVLNSRVDFSAVLRLNHQLNPLLLSIVREYIDITLMLLKKGAQVSVKNERGECPMVLAAMGTDADKQLQMAILLLAFGADPNAKDSHGHDAAHYSIDSTFSAYMQEYAACTAPPRSLKSHAREVTLRQMVLCAANQSLEEKVAQLPLPPSLKEYLLFNNQS